MSTTAKEPFTLKGWHVLLGFVGAFGVIITVNVVMAYQAIHTFPGLEVKNSYVASQTFNEDKKAQEALNWDVSARMDRGNLVLTIMDDAGQPVHATIEAADLGRATNVADDQTPQFAWTGSAYSAPVDLGKGNWNLRLKARAADGTLFQQRIVLHILD